MQCNRKLKGGVYHHLYSPLKKNTYRNKHTNIRRFKLSEQTHSITQTKTVIFRININIGVVGEWSK